METAPAEYSGNLEKECAKSHSRAEARLLWQPSAFALSAHPRGAFLYDRTQFPIIQKTADQFDQLLLNAVLRIFRCTLMILAIDSEALPLLLYTVFCRK